MSRDGEPLAPLNEPNTLDPGDPKMSTIYVTTGFGQTSTPVRRALRFVEKHWSALREWQKRNSLRGAMYRLSDRELQDIGTTRGEIECVAGLRFVGPRGARSV
jgi:uncharacterized protein YjiS (DUF1127 family)